jgi:hypothetical protein
MVDMGLTLPTRGRGRGEVKERKREISIWIKSLAKIYRNMN